MKYDAITTGSEIVAFLKYRGFVPDVPKERSRSTVESFPMCRPRVPDVPIAGRTGALAFPMCRH